jgi:hypothetical protein
MMDILMKRLISHSVQYNSHITMHSFFLVYLSLYDVVTLNTQPAKPLQDRANKRWWTLILISSYCTQVGLRLDSLDSSKNTSES